MTKYRYIGIFRSSDGHTYTLDCTANSTIQAFILLTAKAISMGNHYQLSSISQDKRDGTRNVWYVSDICALSNLLTPVTTNNP